MGGVAYIGFKEGDIVRLLNGFDSYGNVCGRDNRESPVNGSANSGKDMTDKKFVFFMNIKYPRKSLEICVEHCPNKSLNTTSDLQKYAQDEGVSYCDYSVPSNAIAAQPECPSTKPCKGPCPWMPVYKSKDIANLNRCIPEKFWTLATDKVKVFLNFFKEMDFLQRLGFDLKVAWKEMVALGALALVASILMIILIRFLAAIIVYVILVVSALAMAAGTAVLWFMWATHNTPDDEANMIPFLEVAYDTKTAFLVYAIIASVLTAILIIVFIALRNSIALCVDLFQQAGDLFASCPFLLIQPLWTFVFLLAFLAYWAVVAAYLGTSGRAEYNPETTFVEYRNSVLIKAAWAYHAIGLIWISQFILACQELVIGSVVAQYYFAPDKSKVSYPITAGIGYTIKHHLGSLAFGSLIITLVKIPRYILMWVEAQMKGKEDECTKCCLRACHCCLCCLEKCLKFLNRNAYVVIAITGKSFCASAREAFSTLVLNAGRVFALNTIGDFVLFLGKMTVVAVTATTGVFWFRWLEFSSFFVPVLLSCIFAFFIAHCFLSVYEMTIDALLLCTCEAERRQEVRSEFYSSMSRTLSKKGGSSVPKRHSADGEESYQLR